MKIVRILKERACEWARENMAGRARGPPVNFKVPIVEIQRI